MILLWCQGPIGAWRIFEAPGSRGRSASSDQTWKLAKKLRQALPLAQANESVWYPSIVAWRKGKHGESMQEARP